MSDRQVPWVIESVEDFQIGQLIVWVDGNSQQPIKWVELDKDHYELWSSDPNDPFIKQNVIVVMRNAPPEPLLVSDKLIEYLSNSAAAVSENSKIDPSVETLVRVAKAVINEARGIK